MDGSGCHSRHDVHCTRIENFKQSNAVVLHHVVDSGFHLCLFGQLSLAARLRFFIHANFLSMVEPGLN